MKIKNINQANVAFLDKIEEAKFLIGNWLQNSEKIYIQQFSSDLRIPTSYQESIYFKKLEALSKIAIVNIKLKHTNFKPQICTASMFVDRNGSEIVWATQDMSRHILQKPNDDLCIRELKKKQGLLKSGEGYDTCSGCDTTNHSEQNAIAKAISQNKYEALRGSTLYLYDHFWCCDSCRQKLFDAGISNIIIDPKCNWVFGDKPVEWYRYNDL